MLYVGDLITANKAKAKLLKNFGKFGILFIVGNKEKLSPS